MEKIRFTINVKTDRLNEETVEELHQLADTDADACWDEIVDLHKCLPGRFSSPQMTKGSIGVAAFTSFNDASIANQCLRKGKPHKMTATYGKRRGYEAFEFNLIKF